MKKAPDNFTTYTCTYTGCSEDELAIFREFVLSGGEVKASTLHSGMKGAQQLIFCTDGDDIVGVVAVKQPRPSYRDKTARNARIDLSVEDFPVEFGWCVVEEKMRGIGLAYLLVESGVDGLTSGAFATSH